MSETISLENQPLSPLTERRERLGTKVAAGTILALGLFGLTACSSSHVSAEPKPSHSRTTEMPPSALPTPAETESDPNVLPEVDFTVEAMQIPDTFTPEQVAQKLESDIITFDNASETDALDKQWLDYSGTIEDFAAQQAQQDQETFMEALLPPGSTLQGSMGPWVEARTTGHEETLRNWLATYKSQHIQDKEPYKTTQTLNSASGRIYTSADDGNVRLMDLDVSVTGHDNGAHNRVGQTEWDGSTAVSHFLLRDYDGHWDLMQYLDKTPGNMSSPTPSN